MNNRIVIISDTHMGKRGALVGSPDMLRPLWAGASSLVINGDVAEIHDPRYQIKSAEQVLRLHELCEEDAVDLTLLSGNHDPYLSDTRHLKLMNGAVFVTHGDSLHPAIAPWCPSASQVRKAHDRAMSRLEPETRDSLRARLSVSQHAANEHWENYEKSLQHSAWRELLFRPWMAFQILAYWHGIPARADRFVKKYANDTRFFIFGHTHRQGIWQRGGLTLINTGSFGFPGKPHGVVIEHDQLCVYRIRKHRNVFRFDDQPIAKYALNTPTQIARQGAA
jgi:predicted phosphodiesterase